MRNHRNKSYQSRKDNLDIPAKANRVLNVVLVGMLLIVLRIWHLSVIQYDEKVEESRKPQRRVVKEAAKRATIRDRFNIPLAINKVKYNVGLLYSQLKQIPTVAWETGPDGKRVKVFRRRAYITLLSELLAKELDMDAERIEDLIHGKAALYHHIPFMLKEGISESEYYRLKMLEKDWLGISMQRVPHRHYPLGKVAADIIGYMGAINRGEYEKIISETKELESYVEAVDTGEVVSLPAAMETQEQLRRRLKDLHELAYTINDSIGKAGVEGRYESVLRGFHGKKSYYSDARGNFLRELPGTRESLSGKRLLLTISAELQAFAEQLLIQNEEIRQTRLSHLNVAKRTILALKQPWIKGGAVVVMDPNNGEILTLASYPRFDPNDFMPSNQAGERAAKQANINKWLENETYLAAVWNEERPLEREVVDSPTKRILTEGEFLSWHKYLDLVLSAENPMRNGIVSSGTIQDAVTVQLLVDKLICLSPTSHPYDLFNLLYKNDEHQSHREKSSSAETEELKELFTENALEVASIKAQLDDYMGELSHTYDQVLLVDLLRVAVPAHLFSEELLTAVANKSLSTYKKASSAMVAIKKTVKEMVKTIFHDTTFKAWREDNEKEFLKLKRAEEKAAKKYAKPYIDYLDNIEAEMFTSFWQRHNWRLIHAFLTGEKGEDIAYLRHYLKHMHMWHTEIAEGAHSAIDWRVNYKTLQEEIEHLPPTNAIAYLKTLRSYQELNRPLVGSYSRLRKNPDKSQTEKQLAAAFYPRFGCGFGRSQAYRQASVQGSIFKLVTAYEALVQRFHQLEEEGKDTSDLNPLEMVDLIFHEGKHQYLGYHADGKPLPRYYKGGRLPRSASSIGKIDLEKAIETSSNPYFALLAGDVLNAPQDLTDAAKLFSFGERTGIDLPGEIAGKVPDDVDVNRTGLYSLAIGQHTLVVTPLQTSVMLSAMANGGKIMKPKIVGVLAGREPLRGKDLICGNNYFPFQKSLAAVGVDFPLFAAADADQDRSLIQPVPSEVKRTIFMPEAVQKTLLVSMCRVVAKSQRSGLGSLSRMYHNHPEAISDYVELKNQLIGKTSTAESIEMIDLDLKKGVNMYTHVWFGGIAYEEDVIEKNGSKGTYLFRGKFGNAEVVVVVYLRYGGYGREAAPIAAQMVKKWREIKEKYASLQSR